MNQTFKYALSMILGAALVTPAFAQDSYPDVKDDHWAYEAIMILKKEGLMVGYPDGSFNGKKIPTRYEMASAIYAVYTKLKSVTDGLDTKIAALEAKVNGMSGGTPAPANDTQELKEAIAALKNDVRAMKSYSDDIATLKKLTDAFQKELTSLGVDVEAIKKDLSDLSARVKALEDKKPTVDISGDVNFYISTGFAKDGGLGINQDGKGFGFGVGGSNGAGFQDLSVLHEAALNFKGTNETGPKWEVTATFGNTTGGGFVDQSTVANNFGTLYTEGATNFVISKAVVNLGDQSLLGLGFTAKLGRQGFKANPWMFARLDNTSFFSNSRWDNGEWLMDGGVIGFGNKMTHLDVIIGRTSTNTGTNATLQPIVIGAEQYGQGFSAVNANTVFGDTIVNQVGGGLVINRILGADFNTALTSHGTLRGTWLQLDSNAKVGPNFANRAEVYGGDADFKFGRFGIMGGYGKFDLKSNDSKINHGANSRTNAGVSYTADKFMVKGGYYRVEQNYLAPGDWGRTGIFRNVNNVKAYYGDLNLKLSEVLSVKGGYSRLEQIAGGNGKVDSYNAGIDYRMSNGWMVGISYEDVKLKDYTVANPQYKFTTLSLGYDLSAMSKLSFTAQYANITGHPFTNPNANQVGTDAKGVYLGTQLTVKF